MTIKHIKNMLTFLVWRKKIETLVCHFIKTKQKTYPISKSERYRYILRAVKGSMDNAYSTIAAENVECSAVFGK